MAEILKELKDTQASATEMRERYIHAKDSLDHAVLTSPVDGIVIVLNYHTIGGVVHPGGLPVAEISPSRDFLVVEAKIPARNIDSVHVGLLAKMRFSAFKSRTTPMFTGKVVSISADVVVDRNAQPGTTDPNVYMARIEMDMDEFNKVAEIRGIKLHPGMQAEVQIVTGTRTLLKYLFDPITDTMFKAMKEK